MESKKVRTRVTAMVVLCACGLLAYTLIARGGSLEPSGPPGPTMKTLDQVEPRIPIPGSGSPVATFTITQSDSYYLTGDRQCSVTGIVINADNVTIDLMGYSLIGPGAGSGTDRGIYMDGRRNVEIRNGTVRSFGLHGIRESSDNGKGHRLVAVRAVSNGGHGIFMWGEGHLVKDCTATANGDIGISAGTQGTVTGNTASYNQEDGILAGVGCTVTGNSAHSNQGVGIFVWFGCTVTSNTACYNEAWGIGTLGSCTIIGNTACHNQTDGIYLSSHCLVDQNTAHYNNQSGGSYINMDLTRTDCTYGVNRAP